MGDHIVEGVPAEIIISGFSDIIVDEYNRGGNDGIVRVFLFFSDIIIGVSDVIVEGLVTS